MFYQGKEEEKKTLHVLITAMTHIIKAPTKAKFIPLKPCKLLSLLCQKKISDMSKFVSGISVLLLHSVVG